MDFLSTILTTILTFSLVQITLFLHHLSLLKKQLDEYLHLHCNIYSKNLHDYTKISKLQSFSHFLIIFNLNNILSCNMYDYIKGNLVLCAFYTSTIRFFLNFYLSYQKYIQIGNRNEPLKRVTLWAGQILILHNQIIT